MSDKYDEESERIADCVELDIQLAQAQAEIERLKVSLAETKRLLSAYQTREAGEAELSK